ncbi:calcium-responsive transcription factor isoform X2 [Coregonus clupeaformis]|uniref:calcium-responsive transcription factor isoform X2 n=1 Tax=Coregonus clupeaformis TaxID=59861 RepID=UPI001BE0EDE6|nr:calcium-responsive transcription factor isoform X2 [Coregonus clupeaformis]
MEEQERAMEDDALDSKPPLTTEEDEPKHTDLHGSHITETQQEPSEPAPEDNETKRQSSELLVINSLAPPDSWETVHTDTRPEELTKTETLILSQTENQAAMQTQDQTQTLSQTENQAAMQTQDETQTENQAAMQTQDQTQTLSQTENQAAMQTQDQTQTLSQTENQAAMQTQDETQTDEFIILDQNGQPLQCERMVLVSGQSDNGEMYVIPSTQLGGAQVLLPRGQLLDIIDPTGSCGENTADEEELHTITLTAVTDDSSSLTTVTSAAAKTSAQSSQDCFTSPLKPLPSNAPNWAQRLHNAEKIGDSYRGYCNTDTELEAILLLHKQQTNSVFGTRQSPSPAKPASRLMWKSQYVPYDGIPFVNAGSRAVVMECQYGPRRKGLQPKKTAEQTIRQNADYKATCPARIYIKKVCKFPQYRVPTDPNVDKRVVRQEQEKAFFNLRKTLWDVGGVLRYYMQLPTQKAHLYHDMEALLPPPPPDLLFLPMEEVEEEEEEEEEEERGCVCDGGVEDGGTMPSRLHPRVAEKIRELVDQGYHQVYQVRKQLRRFVEREMFKSEEVPERHNLCYFPTVNDIKNHIHEAQKTLQQAGVITDVTQWTEVDPMTETVTLTLTPAPAKGALQRVAVLEGSDTLSPEAVQLFSSLTSLQPKIFAQLQGIQLQPGLCSFDGGLSQLSKVTDSLELPSTSPPQFLQSSPSQGEAMALADPSVVLGMGQVVVVSSLGDGQVVSVSSLGDGQVVSVSSLGDGSVGTHQILLEDGQTIPVQIVSPATIALTSPEEVKEEEVTVNPVD